MGIENTRIANFLEAGADETEPPTPDFEAMFPEPDAVAHIDAMIEEEQREAAKLRRGSSQWIGIQENISHLEYARDRLLDFRARKP